MMSAREPPFMYSSTIVTFSVSSSLNAPSNVIRPSIGVSRELAAFAASINVFVSFCIWCFRPCTHISCG